MAKKTKVTQACIALLEKGQENPGLDVLRWLAKALGVPVAKLLG